MNPGFSIAAAFLILLLGVTSCRDSGKQAGGSADSSGHVHTPPHGGTAVVLGSEDYHLEFVLDPTAGALVAYVLDGHMENFIRIAAPSFTVTARVAGKDGTLDFQAVASSATGEALGDTAQFAAQAEWLKQTQEFDAVISTIAIRGRTFTNVMFNFPKGNDH